MVLSRRDGVRVNFVSCLFSICYTKRDPGLDRRADPGAILEYGHYMQVFKWPMAALGGLVSTIAAAEWTRRNAFRRPHGVRSYL